MACPTAAGLAALARQYFTEGWYPTGTKDAGSAFTPSAALLKAVLVNSSVNMLGGNTGTPKEDAPAIGQGWGRITLDTALYFAGDSRQLLVWDVPNALGVTTNGVREYPITVAAGQPLKVTLAWSDPRLRRRGGGPGGRPGPGSGRPHRHRLPRQPVERRAERRRQAVRCGSGHHGRPQQPGGGSTLSPAAGNYTVRVKGSNVPGYGVKFNQGFGLAVTGGVSLRAAAVLNVKSVTVDDSAGNNNGVIDPGETINLTVELENTGDSSAGATTAVLSTATAGITVTAANGSYGTIGALTTKTNSSPYTFTVGGTVASSTIINFTLNVTTASAGAFSRQFTLKVKPSTPPTISNFVIAEGDIWEPQPGTTYPTYVTVAMQFNYSDPDIDITTWNLYFRVNGRDVTMLPLDIDMTGALTSASGTAGYYVYTFMGVATNIGESLQVRTNFVDSQGNMSNILESNTITFTKGLTPSNPTNLDDDDSFHYVFPGGFSFPFYGQTYTDCWINSDGNISFQGGYEYQRRDPAAFLYFMPRIAGLYTDLAKVPGSNKISVEAFADHLIFHYTNLAQWSQVAPVGSNTVNITLWLDGRIDFQFGSCTMSQSQEDEDGVKWKGVVGVGPGAVLDAPMTDLSAQAGTIYIPPNTPVYQGFRDTDTFDLSNATLHFEPLTFVPVETVYFPRMSYVPGAWADGYGFVNPNASAATVRFTGYDGAGATVGTSDLITWPAHGQGAYQIDGLLGVTQATDAWVKAESDQPGMLGFFLTQEFGGGGLAGLDGAEVWADSTTTNCFLPMVKATGTFSTELFIVNPGAAPITATLTGYDGANTLNGGNHNIPAGGFIKVDVATAFGAGFDGALRVAGNGGAFLGNAVIKDGAVAISSLNLTPFTASNQDLYASHVVLFPDVYYTEINLYNPNGTAATATIPRTGPTARP